MYRFRWSVFPGARDSRLEANHACLAALAVIGTSCGCLEGNTRARDLGGERWSPEAMFRLVAVLRTKRGHYGGTGEQRKLQFPNQKSGIHVHHSSNVTPIGRPVSRRFESNLASSMTDTVSQGRMRVSAQVRCRARMWGAAVHVLFLREACQHRDNPKPHQPTPRGALAICLASSSSSRAPQGSS